MRYKSMGKKEYTNTIVEYIRELELIHEAIISWDVILLEMPLF